MKQKIIASLLIVIMIFSASISVGASGNAATVDPLNMVFESSDAWPSELTNTTTISNDDEIWKFKYSTDSGITYTDFSQSAGNNTHHYAQPLVSDGVVDYKTIQPAGNYTRVYADVNNREYGVNNDATIVLGKWWQAPADTMESRVAKVFTAPYTGTITISAKDESESAKIYVRNNKKQNTAGPKLYIDKKALSDETVTNIWNSAIDHTSPSASEITLTTYDFASVTAQVNEGDEIWFIVSGEQSNNKQTKYVYWNPVVTYVYEPLSVLPSNLSGLGKDEVFTLTFNDELETMTKENVEILGGENKASVKNFYQSDDKKTIGFDFDGLKANTNYTVNISNIIVSGTETEHSYSFNFTTGDIFEYPLCDSDLAWNETANQDTVWQWLYRNTLTMDTLTPYVPYTLTAQNYTNIYVAPIKDENGEYDYSHIGESDEKSRVFCDSQSNAYMRNSLGRYWARLSVGTSTEPMQHTQNEIVKQFTAPETGTVKIYAKDMDGNSKIYNRNITENNRYGAVVKILRKSEDKNTQDESLWSHSFNYVGLTIPVDSVAECELEPFEINVEKGEKIWFVISGELGGSAYAKQVFFRPVVEYTNVLPNIVSTLPKNNSSNVVPNFVHRVTFDHNIELPDASNIEIDNGASVKSVSLDDDKVLSFSFSGLKPYTKYTVKLNNIVIKTTSEENKKVYEYSFTTGSTVEFGEITISDNTLKMGENTVSVGINNASGTSSLYSATLLVAICDGSEENYNIKSVHYARRDDIGENDTLSCDINIADTNGHFVKALLLEDVSSAKALLPVKIFK